VTDVDVETNGPWEQLDILALRLIDHVVPRRFGNLERDGHSVRLYLIHADLREGRHVVRRWSGPYH